MSDELKPENEKGRCVTVAPAVPTNGEVFPDGSIVEPIRSSNGSLELMLWDGTSETTGSLIEHGGIKYEPAATNRSLFQGLILPTRCCPHGTTRQLLAEIRKLLEDFAGLPTMSASLAVRFVLCSWLVEALQVAPALVLVGPDIERANRLVKLLRRLCRHSVFLTGVTPAGICSLASGAQFTYIISQCSLSDKLWGLLNDASIRDRKIPFRGRLLDLFGLQVIHTDEVLAGELWPPRSIQISMVSTGQELPLFDAEILDQVTTDLQAKLLSFRRVNLGAARRLQFDASKFAFALRDLARCMAAATPDDPALQAEVIELLGDQDAEFRSEKWIDPNAIAGEAVQVACFESPGGVAYVSDLAEIAQEILRRRGGDSSIDPAVFGKRLKFLGFTTKRDAKGKKLQLTDAVRNRAEQLGRDFGSPEAGDDRQKDGRQKGMGAGPTDEVCT